VRAFFDAFDAVPADVFYTLCAALAVAFLIVERAVARRRAW
jgi:hypothetical protein